MYQKIHAITTSLLWEKKRKMKQDGKLYTSQAQCLHTGKVHFKKRGGGGGALHLKPTPQATNFGRLCLSSDILSTVTACTELTSLWNHC